MTECECGEPVILIKGEKWAKHMGGRNHWGAMQKLGKVQPRKAQPAQNESGLREDMSEAEVRAQLNAVNEGL